MKKILFTFMALAFASNLSFASLTVEQARSAEQLDQEGYSKEVIRSVQMEAGEFNPRPTNIFQKVGFKFWHYIDPASPEARDERLHKIEIYPTYSDY